VAAEVLVVEVGLEVATRVLAVATFAVDGVCT
jgi:hypothetical protein